MQGCAHRALSLLVMEVLVLPQSKATVIPADAAAQERQRVAARHEEDGYEDRSSLRLRVCSTIEVGGVRQSLFTLVQTAVGGGMLIIPSALQMSGLALGLLMLAFNGLTVFLGLDVMMRGAVRLEVKDTAALLAKCIGKWSGPAMDLLCMLYGNGTIITFFILLGDFIPVIVNHMIALSWLPPFEAPFGLSMRTASILGSLCIILPLSVPAKLSALRYLSPVALVAVVFTAFTIVVQTPTYFEANIGKPSFGDIEWVVLDWNFFKCYGMLLFVCNCHLNVVPVVSEMKLPSRARIHKVTSRVALVVTPFYGLIGAGGYLSHLGNTKPNILTNYPIECPAILLSMALMCCTVLVGVPCFVNPSARSLRCFLRALRLAVNPKLPLTQMWSPLYRPDGEMAEALLAAESQDNGANIVMVGDGPVSVAAEDDGGSTTATEVSTATEEDVAGQGRRQGAVRRQQTSEQIGVVRNEVVRLALTALCLIVDVSVAIRVRSVGDIGGFVGAFAGLALMVGLPFAVLLKLRTQEFSRNYFVLATCVLGLASVLACSAVAIQLLQAMGVLRT